MVSVHKVVRHMALLAFRRAARDATAWVRDVHVPFVRNLPNAAFADDGLVFAPLFLVDTHLDSRRHISTRVYGIFVRSDLVRHSVAQHTQAHQVLAFQKRL